ncbi:uncharacterized protein BDZ83DRAFT_778460 [Colletotrichum acutatum]|uniref:Uncharacterized protein n=1 Tax=Glomerella acutata TaxID=27357 RepID=A0AAD8UHZ9_GLOAC|nr:uncharacterized protein BDZ83DRAFT_778460 [Colletotrichum acutatum]KAK1724637.1 hypothetical protein BDZ83DRAFT_778460 [Colletotrichum acutatum]
MTEPENFEEDLFADLYDDDTPAKPAAAQQPAPPPAPVAVPQQSVETHAEPPPQPEAEYGGGGGDDQMKYEEEDDDDEVDFNLGGDGGGGGGGGSGGNTGYAPPSNGFAGNKQEEPTYSTSTAKNPSAKEDGWDAYLDWIKLKHFCCGLRELGHQWPHGISYRACLVLGTWMDKRGHQYKTLASHVLGNILQGHQAGQGQNSEKT